MGALESLLASSNAAPSPAPAQGGALEKLLGGGSPAEPTAPAPAGKPAPRGGSSNLLIDDLVGGTADAIDLVWTGLFAAPVAIAGEAITRAQLGVNSATGLIPPMSRREIGKAGQATAARLNEQLGTPVRSTLKALGLLSDRPMAVEKAMQYAMSLVDRDAASVEERTGGVIQKEDVLMGVNALFGALGAKGVQYVAKTVPERAKAKEALKELAKIRAEGNARNAAADAEALNREAGGIPREVRPQDNPAARDANTVAFDQRVNAERQAYDLMQSGASTAKVEAAIKRNPAVDAALADIREKRQYYAQFLQEDPSPPIREDGSFREGALSSMLRRPSEMGPAELRARDAAAGISRGPLGEPIFSANPQPQGPGRSSRDPSRRPATGSGLMGIRAPEPSDPFGAAATGGRSNADPRRPQGPSNLMGTPAPRVEQFDPFGAAATGGRSAADPTRRPATGSGLEGQPVKRDSLGTPLSPNQTLAVVGATGLGLAAYYADEGDRGDLATAAASGALLLGKGRGISLEAIRALPDTATLREIRDASAYTLNTLENLPGNRAVHSKQAIGELLRRQEVTKAERDILQGVLNSVPGDSITAKQLMAGVKEATGDFELKPVASQEFADYGLGNIDRSPADDYDYITPDMLSVESNSLGNRWVINADGNQGLLGYPKDEVPTAEAALELARQEILKGKEVKETATTTIYQSPFELGTNNHFGDPNYFAHTRSFYQGGIKHVVEMQSDLAQNAGKVLTEAERAELVERKAWADRVSLLAKEAHTATIDARSTNDKIVARVNAYFAGLEDIALDRKLAMGNKIWNDLELGPLRNQIEAKDPGGRAGHMGNYDVVIDTLVDEVRTAGPQMERATNLLENVLYYEQRTYNLLRREVEAKLKGTGSLERVIPMLKRWDKRLVREELAESARGRVDPKVEELRDIAELHRQGARNNVNYPENARALNKRADAAEAEMAALPRLPPEPVVRFATADTVAKVENWTDNREVAVARVRRNVRRGDTDPAAAKAFEDGYFERQDVKDEIARSLREYEIKLKKAAEEATTPAERLEKLAKIPEQVRTATANMAKAAKYGKHFASPEHAGLYVRYAEDVTSFLKQLGGKPFEDSTGNTWIEVPTEGTRKTPAGRRAQQFGFADPKLLATIAAVGGGIAVASLLSDEENKAKNAALTAVGVSLALFARSRASGLADWAQPAVAGAERYLGIVSTRVGNMSPVLLRRMREHERGVLTRTNDYLKAIGPFVEGLRKVPEALRTQLDAAILTGDPAKITAVLGKTGNPELVGQFRQVRALLGKVGGELMQAGKLKGLLSDYYPRIVTDVPGLLNALGKEERTFIEKQIADATRKTQREALRDLTPFEVSQIINKALKNPRTGNGKPGFLKRRAVEEVTPELAKFYAPASESLPLYLRAVSKELERASFFGENLLRDPVTGAVNLDESIGNLVRQERLAGRVTADQAVELGDILRSRFGPGERATSRPLQAAKNLAYAGLLGHVTSAITQLGDVAIAAAAHGILPTIKAIQQSVTRQPGRATVRDLGMIDHMAEEIVSASRTPVTVAGHQLSTAKFLDKVFRYSGFSWVDKVGKNVSIQASKNKLEGWAKTPAGIKKLEAKYGKAYDAREMQQLVADLRSGELTELVKGVMFSELSDVQPISKLEVPQGYLDNPNGRVLYMLKTFMLKQADIVRREVVQEFRTGSKVKATEKALRFGVALGLGGATTQWINNWLLGRDREPEMMDIPMNALKTFGWSQYTIDKVREGKPLQAAADVVAPPYKMFDTIISQDPAAIQYIPVVGRLYYARDWFDLMDESGSEKANRKLEREQRRKEREE